MTHRQSLSLNAATHRFTYTSDGVKTQGVYEDLGGGRFKLSNFVNFETIGGAIVAEQFAMHKVR